MPKTYKDNVMSPDEYKRQKESRKKRLAARRKGLSQ